MKFCALYLFPIQSGLSDKHITEKCGYLNKLFPGDVVLADRGFNVHESDSYRGATLNIATSLQRKVSTFG